MIDAVAKALARWAVPVNDWDALAEEQRERWRDAARVAIEEMRNPTDRMCDAAGLTQLSCGAYREMIHAALTEGAST